MKTQTGNGRLNRLAAITLLLAPLSFTLPHTKAEEEPPAARTTSQVYRDDPRRTLTIYYPDGWDATDRRPALVIFRCNIPEQREYFRKRGMVVIKPQTAPVNSGKLPELGLEEIAQLPKPRDQVADTKSAIRYIRTHSHRLGIDPEKIVATGTSGGGDLALLSHLNRTFQDAGDDKEVSPSPNALVLYSPAFDGIDIWFVKSATVIERTRAEAPDFLPLLPEFADTEKEYAQPLDHRATLLARAAKVAEERGISAEQTTAFQDILGQFNKRDWQLLHPAEDALQMSASRLISKEPLPPTIILLGERDHLREHQVAFLKVARKNGQKFELKEYPSGGHSFMTQPAFVDSSTQEVDQFLQRVGILSAK